MASVSIFLDTRRIKKSKKHPIKLRVIHHRSAREYSTIFELSEVDYKKLAAPRISEGLLEIKRNLQEVTAAAEAVLQELDPFSFSEFERAYIGNGFVKIKLHKDPEIKPVPVNDEFDYSPYLKRFTIFKDTHTSETGLSVVFLAYIKKLLQQGRTGSAINYQRSYRSLKAFKGNGTLQEVTVSYLYQYERWMLEQGNSKTSVGIVLRPLRSIFNEAIEEGLIKRDKHYPFGRRKYQIPASRNLKKALTQEELKQIYYFQPNAEKQAVGKAYWLFCYLANGMNVKDMILLKWKNIQGEYLIFERFKTEKSTRADQKPITVYLSEDLWQIINTHGNSSRKRNDYVFPILQNNLDQLQQFNILHQIRKDINKAMGEISKELGIEKKVTTIVTRHSFSTQLKRAGVSTEFIQEALGHTDKKTTENYLDSFEKEVKKEYASKLTAFKE